jgi:hypothetical protein
MIFLGTFKAGASVFYAGNFHSDQGTIENPTSPEAQLRTPAGVWSDLTTPAIQNAKVGHFGGTIDTTGFAAGQYVIRMAGTVSTAKETATEFCFEIVTYDISDAATVVWAQVLAELSSVPGVTASVKDALNWIFTLARNKRTQTNSTETVLKDDESTPLATSTKSDDGTTFTRGEYS